MSSILADLTRTHVARARMRANADQIERLASPTPDVSEVRGGCLPGLKTSRNCRSPKPEFRDVFKSIEPSAIRAAFEAERQVLRQMLAGAGVEHPTCKPTHVADPSISVIRPYYATDAVHNEGLNMGNTEADRQRRLEAHAKAAAQAERKLAEHSRLIAERRAAAFAAQARAFDAVMNPAD